MAYNTRYVEIIGKRRGRDVAELKVEGGGAPIGVYWKSSEQSAM